MGGIFKSIGKIAQIALPVALTAATGGSAAPVTFGSIAASVGKSLAVNALTGALSSAIAPKAKASPVTGQTAAPAATTTDTSQTAEQVAENEKKKRLALNAAGASGNTTSPLGVTGSANVTKRNLLGL